MINSNHCAWLEPKLLDSSSLVYKTLGNRTSDNNQTKKTPMKLYAIAVFVQALM